MSARDAAISACNYSKSLIEALAWIGIWVGMMNEGNSSRSHQGGIECVLVEWASSPKATETEKKLIQELRLKF